MTRPFYLLTTQDRRDGYKSHGERHCNNFWSITESILAQGRARGKLGGDCWWYLSIKLTKKRIQMKSTSRLRVLSNRILLVLVIVYFCRGLSGNTEERPTRRGYIEISTCRVILQLEDSRSHGKEVEVKQSLALGAYPGDQGARPPSESNQDSLSESISTDLRIKDNRSINIGLIQRPIFTWRDYKTRPPGPWRREPLNPNSLFIKGEEASDQA